MSNLVSPSSPEAPTSRFCVFLQAPVAQRSAAPSLSPSRRRQCRPFPWSPCLCVSSPRPPVKLWNPEQSPISFDGEDDPGVSGTREGVSHGHRAGGHYQESAILLAPSLRVQPSPPTPPHPRLLKALTHQQLVVSSNTQLLLCSSCTQPVAFN